MYVAKYNACADPTDSCTADMPQHSDDIPSCCTTVGVICTIVHDAGTSWIAVYDHGDVIFLIRPAKKLIGQLK